MSDECNVVPKKPQKCGKLPSFFSQFSNGKPDFFQFSNGKPDFFQFSNGKMQFFRFSNGKMHFFRFPNNQPPPQLRVMDRNPFLFICLALNNFVVAWAGGTCICAGGNAFIHQTRLCHFDRNIPGMQNPFTAQTCKPLSGIQDMHAGTTCALEPWDVQNQCSFGCIKGHTPSEIPLHCIAMDTWTSAGNPN